MEENRDETALEEALREHKELQEIQDRLAGLFGQPASPAFQNWAAEVREQLTRMVGLLESHFALEEQQGLHDEIVEALPNQSCRLEKLLKEHGQILAQIRAVRDLSLGMEGPPQDQELRREASGFFVTLDKHERAERELFIQALEGEGQAPD